MNQGFRDLEVWQDAKALAVSVYQATGSLKDLSLKDQLRRAAISIPSNIAEGDERGTDKDSVRFLFIAKGSLAELRTQLEIASEVGLLPPNSIAPLEKKAHALGLRIGALIQHRSPPSAPLSKH